MKFLAQIFLATFFFVSLINPSEVRSESITVTAEVGETIVVLSGYTSPGSFITFSENSAIVGSATSDSSGFFSKTFEGIVPGVHSFQIQSTDQESLQSTAISISFLAIQNQQVLISNIYLPPTIMLTQNDQNVDIWGYTAPSSLVDITITGRSGIIKSIYSDSNGFYKVTFDISNFLPGEYVVTAELKVNFSSSTTVSQQLKFNVFIGRDQSIIISSDDLIPIDLDGSKKCRYFYKRLCEFDQEDLGYMDIRKVFPKFFFGFVDFFIQRVSNIYDINEDSVVNPEDLSIFLYYTRSEPYQVLGLSNSEDKNSSANIDLGELSNLDISTYGGVNIFLRNLFQLQLILGGVSILFILVNFVFKRNG
jgi:hypothetical protein